LLAARRSFDLSFTWRSIWGSKSLLLEGLVWKVGTGWSINAKTERWVMLDGKYSCPKMIDDNTVDFMVGELIEFETRSWNLARLNSLFEPPSVKGILAIPIALEGNADKLFWTYTKHGFYTVRSGYWLGRMNTFRRNNEGNAEGDQKLWREVWNLNGPPKLRHFLWRADTHDLCTFYPLIFTHIMPSLCFILLI
jgi:hypothetical protein